MDPCDFSISVEYSDDLTEYVAEVKEIPELVVISETYDGAYRLALKAIEKNPQSRMIYPLAS